MAKTWVCGDTHGTLDLMKLHPPYWAEGYQEDAGTKDVLIVAGDLGVHWSRVHKDEEESLKAFWRDVPYTTLWIDGNHENFDTIKNLPRIRATEIPGKVGVEPLAGTDPTLGVSTDGLYHLQRGGVYRINGQVFFFMGGGTSIDKLRRVEGVSWWPEELPS
ncbi:MAG: metallophosphoesterase, partial [Actinobacteria bacterium]|nr:metallophosphoesterase [Actinomycetota bacterium]